MMERRIPRLLGLNAEPTAGLNWFLVALPFVLLVFVYFFASHARLSQNPEDKLLPSAGKMAQAVKQYVWTEDRSSGEYLMVGDTVSSLRRLVVGVGSAAVFGLFIGLNIGLFPGFRAFGNSFVKFLSIIPPLAILPILFIAFGVGEVGKVMLIFLGTVFLIARDVTLTVESIPREQIVKALTLGASGTQTAYRIILPQVMPRLVNTVRLSLGPAWLFLIASEAIASTDGLGYRIFLVRRYLAMDLIIPLVFWITFLGFFMDLVLRKFTEWKYSWYVQSNK
jgi:NitT/TauT family transport system permease protein